MDPSDAYYLGRRLISYLNPWENLHRYPDSALKLVSTTSLCMHTQWRARGGVESGRIRWLLTGLVRGMTYREGVLYRSRPAPAVIAATKIPYRQLLTRSVR